MDLGCLDLGCISVPDNKSTADTDSKENDACESRSATSKIGKNKSLKEAGQSTLSSLSKFTSQIKKPSHRKSSPLNWFPRKKVDSYLKRKIKMLQEVDGMNLTLDETLGDSNPHYSRVLREKMAAREAAHKAMEAQKAALVEASWCRILKAARIPCKEAEAQLVKAEKTAAEAFEAATAVGVIMYDKPHCPWKPGQVEPSSMSNGSTTHAVTASFESAFEVDKQVATAVRTALIRLLNCRSFSKDEFKVLLRKISQNPDTGETNQELSEFSSHECESESGSEHETVSQKDGSSPKDLGCKIPVSEVRKRRNKRRQSLEKFNMTSLVDMMLERLQSLQEEELSSLATIVATCGLNAVLAEVENSKLHNPCSSADFTSNSSLGFPHGAGKLEYMKDGQTRRKHTEPELPSLDKFLVKHVTKLEREVQEARNSRNSVKTAGEKADLGSNDTSSESIPELGSIFLKHSSKFEKEIEEAKRNYGKRFEGAQSGISHMKKDVPEIPSLDKFLVKHMSRLEKEVEEARNRNKNDPREGGKVTHSYSGGGGLKGKENVNLNKEVEVNPKRNMTEEAEDSLDKILVKPIHRLEREKMQAKAIGNNYGYKKLHKDHGGNTATECESLDKVLVKHVSRLEKEKMHIGSEEESMEVNRNNVTKLVNEAADSLDQVLVKHKSTLEREKLIAAQQPEDQMRLSVTRREARERELQEAWGGLSLGNSMKPHLSKLERDKAAWIKAEKEERRQEAMGFSD
ncbi:hypothetical protein FNV43_RR22617 [Rhamnella rubrinervis]|uniref:Uncharacterized protein n=1 Tax=Rhamnella rubrinervis TaxID=2594499 RepID=A0A8K0DWH9_9ROSA|nr:hypothetical protein FNV43_RR22617 [Rhamnella rubrinervis]